MVRRVIGRHNCPICNKHLKVHGVQILPENAPIKVDHIEWLGTMAEVVHPKCSEVVRVCAQALGIKPQRLFDAINKINDFRL